MRIAQLEIRTGHCPYCILEGITVKQQETNVILTCQSVDEEGRKLHLTNYILKLKSQGKIINQTILRSYLGGGVYGAAPEIEGNVLLRLGYVKTVNKPNKNMSAMVYTIRGGKRHYLGINGQE